MCSLNYHISEPNYLLLSGVNKGKSWPDVFAIDYLVNSYNLTSTKEKDNKKFKFRSKKRLRLQIADIQ